MKSRTIRIALMAFALLVAAAPASAQDKPKPGAAGAASAQPGKKETGKAAQPARLVDINSAGKAELKKLPGIGDTDAEKIIAGRPYRSKAELATRKVIPTGIYMQIKANIIAKQKPEPASKAAAKSR